MGTEEMKSLVDATAGYGALGIVTAYFMYKDMVITKQLENTLSKFTVAMETFFKVSGNNGEAISK